MIRHIVFWKMKPEAEGLSASENADRIVSALRSLAGKVPGIVELRCGRNSVALDGNWDVALEVLFADEDTLQAYQVHPEHQKVVALVRQVVSARAAVDLDC